MGRSGAEGGVGEIKTGGVVGAGVVGGKGFRGALVDRGVTGQDNATSEYVRPSPHE